MTPNATWRKLLASLNRMALILKESNCDDQMLMAWQNLHKVLSEWGAHEIEQVVGENAYTKPAPSPSPEWDDSRLASLSLEEIRGLIANDAVSRKELERIARFRFGMTAGGISNLRNRRDLVEKLSTLISHEATHDAIARVAQSS